MNDFVSELRRMARSNGIPLTRERGILGELQQDMEQGAAFLNILRGSDKNELLLVTSHRTLAVRVGAFSTKTLWSVDHADVSSVRATRQVIRGSVIDLIELETPARAREFWFGFFPPEMYVELEIAEHNASIAEQQISEALSLVTAPSAGPGSSSAGSLFSFDPEGPEKAGAAGKDAYNNFQWSQSFLYYVKAMDRLHDFYVYEGFRNRQPSPKDAWLVDGLVSALGVTRDRDPNFSVREGVREATHRLRTIMTAVERAGGNATLYRGGLDGLRRYAPDINVDDIFWE